MHDKPKAMVLASFAADSLALGVHWIYNTGVIDKKFGQVERFIKPERPTYHPTKDLGEFTHYGDQSLILLESVSACNGFDLSDFSSRLRPMTDISTGRPKEPSKTWRPENRLLNPDPDLMILPVHPVLPRWFMCTAMTCRP